MKNQKVSDGFTLGMFFLLLVLPILFISWTGGEVSSNENRVLANKPSFFLENGNLNPHAYTETSEWLEDHIGFRTQFIRLCSEIKFRIFGQSPSERVHIGKNNWYYYTLDHNLEIATGDYPLTEETLKKMLSIHLAIREKLSRMGIDYVIILPASKVSIYPEYLRIGNGQLHRTPVDEVADYLEANSDLHVIRLKEVLLAEKGNGQLYYKNDTHWNQKGAYIGYKQIIDKMKEWDLCSVDPVEVRYTDAEYCGEFGAMMGVDLPAEHTVNTVIDNPKGIKYGLTEKNTVYNNLLDKDGLFRTRYYYENPEIDGPNVVLFGDSMFEKWGLPELLSENFSSLAYVWSMEVKEDIIEGLMPDLVVYELTERFTDSFVPANIGFLQKQLNEPGAKIDSLIWNGSELTINVENTGKEAWSEDDQIRLGLFDNGTDTGIRAILAVDRVNPGEKTQFTLDFSSYNDDSPKNAEVQMLQEGIQYFGERKSLNGIGGNNSEESSILYSDDIEPLANQQQAPVGTQVFDAQIISCSVSGSEGQDDPRSVTVNVLNRGTEAWSNDNHICLCVWKNGEDPGLRIFLPEGAVVRPGETFKFVSEGAVLRDAGNAALEFQMVQEGVQYFGERRPMDNAGVNEAAEPSGSREFDAQIVSHTVPETVKRGESQPIAVTVLNSGTEAWSNDNHICLCIWKNDADEGYRIYLPEGTSVGPGETFDFSLDDFTLYDAQTPILEFQMVQEGAQYFGEREKVSLSIEE